MLLLLLLLACSTAGQPCQGQVPGHGVLDGEGTCWVLPTWEHGESDPEQLTELSASPTQPIDWQAVNSALAQGPVRVRFAPGLYPERLDILRTDQTDNRLILDGSGSERATVPGVSTGYEVDPQSYITVRGFEVTGSADKGVFWWSGDQVVLEDLVVHDNRGTPAINLNYSSRTQHISSGFVVRNSHVYDQRGECIYIGGAEGLDQDSHAYVQVANNLVHDCVSRTSTRNDGINIKDRIGHVDLFRNVVFRTDWGIEVASPGVYSHNLVFDTERNGFHVSDSFQAFPGEMLFHDNVVLNPGENGFYINAKHGSQALITLSQNSVFGAPETGITLASEDGAALLVRLADLLLVDNAVGIDGWGEPSVVLEGCAASGNGLDLDRVAADLPACQSTTALTPAELAGPDNTWFTDDDPWLLGQGAGPLDPR